MDGLIILLLDDKTSSPGRSFWEVFGSIRPDLDRMFWCFGNQPWMGFPSDDLERLDQFESEHLEPFEDEGTTGVQLWRPGTLGLYADKFAEEWIELWAIEPTHDDPALMALEYSRSPWGKEGEIIEQHARIWLTYMDGTCWEIYARQGHLLEQVRRSLQGRSGIAVHPSRSNERGQSFGDAGLAEVWRSMNGQG